MCASKFLSIKSNLSYGNELIDGHLMIIFAMKMDENIWPFYFDHQGEGGRDKRGCLIAPPQKKKKKKIKNLPYFYLHPWLVMFEPQALISLITANPKTFLYFLFLIYLFICSLNHKV